MVLKAGAGNFLGSALKQCKPHQLVGILEVRYGKRRFLHRVIHTNVEIFTGEKYLRRSSAELMQCGRTKKTLASLKNRNLRCR